MKCTCRVDCRTSSGGGEASHSECPAVQSNRHSHERAGLQPCMPSAIFASASIRPTAPRPAEEQRARILSGKVDRRTIFDVSRCTRSLSKRALTKCQGCLQTAAGQAVHAHSLRTRKTSLLSSAYSCGHTWIAIAPHVQTPIPKISLLAPGEGATRIWPCENRPHAGGTL